MNKQSWLNTIKGNHDLKTQLIISAVFTGLILVFLWSLDRYWRETLKPRLYLATETQAKILAESQATTLVEILSRTDPEHLKTALFEAVQMMLIVENPATGERFIRNLKLQLDYSTVEAPEGELDLNEGEKNCQDCFIAEVPLISHYGELLGLATFSVSSDYYQVLSQEMKRRLFTESSFTLGLLVTVWLLMMLMFYRLNRAKKIIEQSDQAKTRFMANVTHELRTPLNTILGYTQLYKQDTNAMQNYGQGIKAIDRSADHLLLMINDILEFSRANEENLTLHPTEVDLLRLLNTLVEMTQISAQVKNLSFDVYFEPQLPARVKVDEKRLRQILLNLLSNAVKFTSTGRVSFTVKCKANKAQACRLYFEIEDSGIGIARTQLQTIFIPFHQLDNAITRAEGTGLGLTISQRLVSLMGAKLEVSSEANKGSRFWFELDLPVVGQENIQLDTNSATNPQSAPITLPNAQTLATLKENAQRHNVLGTRACIEKMEADPQLAEFVTQIKPFVSHYKFKQLVEWLDKHAPH